MYIIFPKMIEIMQFIEMNKFLHFGNKFSLQQQYGKFHHTVLTNIGIPIIRKKSVIYFYNKNIQPGKMVFILTEALIHRVISLM